MGGFVTLWIASALQLQAMEPSVPTVADLRGYFCGGGHIPFALSMRETVFYHERQLRPRLRAFLRDKRCSAAARDALALIGDPQDVALLVKSVPEFANESSGRWAYSIASALLEPNSDAEWSFLRAAALNDFRDRWADAAAIMTLKLIASPRSLALLREVQRRNSERPKTCARAIGYILSNPPPLRDIMLDRLAVRVAETNRVGEWNGNRKTRYNAQRDKALVDIEYVAGRDVLIYTATFHKTEGFWRLRGFRETLQMLRVQTAVPVEDPPLPDLVTSPAAAPMTSDDVLRLLPPLEAPPPTGKPAEKK